MAYGSSGMAQTPSTSSTQYTISINGSYQNGDVIQIKNAEGVIYDCTLKKNCQSFVLSIPEFKAQETYSVVVNDEEIETITITSTVTNVGGGNNSWNIRKTKHNYN